MSSVNFLEKLLDGAVVEWKSLASICKIETGKLNANAAAEDGSYMFFTTAKEVSKIDKYRWDTEALLIAGNANVGDVKHYSGKFEAYQRTYVLTNFSEKLNVRYLFHIVSNSLKQYLEDRTNSAAMTYIVLSTLENFPIPIPCPDNPKKSLEIQAEIVRILDKFTALSSELSTELSWRKKQLKHYYFELFQFSGKTQYLKIKDCCDIKKGKTAIKKATPGEYQLVATTEERQSSSEYQFDCSAVCVPLISSRGHGVASIDRIYFQEGKFALGNILCAIIPNDGNFLSAKFLRHYLFDKKDVTLVPLMRGGANVSLTIDSLKDVEIPIPPIAEQQRIVRILDKFEELVKGLPREIKLREKQYAYYRDLLLSFPQAQAA
ncbi:restriction endonuclease subunit S [Comamonas aquatica]|uniref:restriction endonuclease subunit S n=1 Tax=Comamonas aquatica TaxID=225991 RepID=UPI0021B14E93|nr:restriction endonuclease subunit S [Comamonas aquatica]